MARITALIYNWWTIFMRLGIPDKHARGDLAAIGLIWNRSANASQQPNDGGNHQYPLDWGKTFSRAFG